jgi:hypothetical protein
VGEPSEPPCAVRRGRGAEEGVRGRRGRMDLCCCAAGDSATAQRRAAGGTRGRGERAPGACGVGSGGLVAAPARWPVGESPNRDRWVRRWGDRVGGLGRRGRASGGRAIGHRVTESGPGD